METKLAGSKNLSAFFSQPGKQKHFLNPEEKNLDHIHKRPLSVDFLGNRYLGMLMAYQEVHKQTNTVNFPLPLILGDEPMQFRLNQEFEELMSTINPGEEYWIVASKSGKLLRK